VRVPDISLDWAMELVAAGVRIAWEQLLAAANSMVAGVEVWVQTQQQHRVTGDIPLAAVTLCCRKARNWVSAGGLWGFSCCLDTSCIQQHRTTAVPESSSHLGTQYKKWFLALPLIAHTALHHCCCCCSCC
jgi:hypothetical protein